MSTPSWVGLIAVLCWAALSYPVQSHGRLSAGLLDGIDLPSIVAKMDRHASLQPNGGRRSESARGGNPPAVAHTVMAIEPPAISVIEEPAVSDIRVARLVRSPAQPRAPPAKLSAQAD
jgi:hypothetical protein